MDKSADTTRCHNEKDSLGELDSPDLTRIINWQNIDKLCQKVPGSNSWLHTFSFDWKITIRIIYFPFENNCVEINKIQIILTAFSLQYVFVKFLKKYIEIVAAILEKRIHPYQLLPNDLAIAVASLKYN